MVRVDSGHFKVMYDFLATYREKWKTTFYKDYAKNGQDVTFDSEVEGTNWITQKIENQ